MLALRLPLDIEKRLEALAKSTGRTKSYYAREAIVRHLEDLEDVFLAEQRLTDLRSGRVNALSADEMSERLGLED